MRTTFIIERERRRRRDIKETDELMDRDIVRCDVEFGMTVDPMFAGKASPSHESDSGCSDMGDIRSVSPLCDEDLADHDQVQLFDFDSVDSVRSIDKFDEELQTYLTEPLTSREGTLLTTSEANVPESPSIKFHEPQSPELNVESDSNDEEVIMPKKRIIQSKAVVSSNAPVSKSTEARLQSKPQATVIKLPQSVSSRPTDIHILPHSKFATSSLQPSLKVVKVVKTASSSKQDISNELIQALEDRNKKNAVQAKMNREKKKAYIKSLEDEIEALKCENFVLKENKNKTDREKEELIEEIQYLRSVLANQSMLSGLLKNIGNLGNAKMSSSIGRKRSADFDHDYEVQNAKCSRLLTRNTTAGVCLHVDQGSVSLEFCSKCASMAKSSENE